MGDAFRICSSDELLETGAGRRFEVSRGGTAVPAFAVRYKGRAYAFLNRCAHVSVELDWEPGQFFDGSRLYLICSTHGAIYEPESGHCVAGPCRGARLVAVPVEERDGSIFLKGVTE